MAEHSNSLEDKYTATEGRVFVTGLQALVRLPMAQMRRDRSAGLNTAAFISGYRGSPLGGYDQQLIGAGKFLDLHGVRFQPGINEELAATAIWGTQQLHLSPGARKDGVVGIWYGKGPGVDRSGDVFKHANAAGTSRHGGVVCLAGDDHSCKSSTLPHQSDHAFMSAMMPLLYPSSIHEFLDLGLLAIAMSRYSGCWVGLKFISDTVETSAAIDLACESREFACPGDFQMPEGGLNLRWPDPPLIQDHRLQNLKVDAAIAFARANSVDQPSPGPPRARFGVVASGKAYEDVLQALRLLEIGAAEAAQIGMRLYKVRMPWPLEPTGIRAFCDGLREVLVVEERREIIENQIKQHLFNWRSDVRPRIIGKLDEKDRHFLALNEALSVGAAARAIANRVLRFDLDDGLKQRITDKLAWLERRHKATSAHQAPVTRVPYYCSGCPHNTSTRVPEGSRALAGIGCHYMVQWMGRRTETFTQMGGEGATWSGVAPFTDEEHVFANLGDGTYFHSGILAIRQSVSAGVNITYKVLYNDAVAMTGGQPLDGKLTPGQVTHQLHQEGVAPIYLLSDRPGAYRQRDLAPGVVVRHRDHIDTVMTSLRGLRGCSAIVYVQACAAETRRRRKRGLVDDPAKRVFINAAVCEGCGDCSDQSNCLSIEPLETEFGRKRRINQSSCNKDFSCLKGFCPSFVTIYGGQPRRRKALAGAETVDLPEPETPEIGERAWNIAVAGIGGTGVVTIGAILGMAAHLDGTSPMILDMAGLAQKGGAVFSHIRLGRTPDDVTSPRIATGSADLLIAADGVVAASKDGIMLCDAERTHAVVNTKINPVADFLADRDLDFRAQAVEETIRAWVEPDAHFANFTRIAEAVIGDAIATNIMMVGYAWQCGLIPLPRHAIERAIELNGVAVPTNLAAFAWGRRFAADRDPVERMVTDPAPVRSLDEMTLEEVIEHHSAYLTAYQDERLASRYRAMVARARDAASAAGLDETLPLAVARTYARILAPKDEYEVARLLTDPAFKALLDEQFEGDTRLKFNLAPPLLPGTAADGRPRKREFGSWIMPVLRLLAGMKGLRGSVFDVFAHTRDRRIERALVEEYETLVPRLLAEANRDTAETVRALVSLYDEVRGFGPVKRHAIATMHERQGELLEALDRPARAKVARTAA